MASVVCRVVLRRLRAAGPAPPAASSGAWSRILPPHCADRAGPGCEPRRELSARGSMNVFNREMKKRQRNWAASQKDGHQYDYLRDEVGEWQEEPGVFTSV